MAYREGLSEAARRHLAAATSLYRASTPATQRGNSAIAGYLFGLAGELAVKQIMAASGIKRLPSDRRADDPYYAHFPQLRGLIRDQVTGRLQSELLRISSNEALFQHWDIKMRYARTEDVRAAWIRRWETDARSLVEIMETYA